MKHGRVAMAGSLPDYSSFDGLSAPAVWAATPQAARLQILCAAAAAAGTQTEL